MTDQGRNCWDCDYQQIGGETFLGMCTYFSAIGKPNKEIPPQIVDEGCKHWRPKETADNKVR